MEVPLLSKLLQLPCWSSVHAWLLEAVATVSGRSRPEGSVSEALVWVRTPRLKLVKRLRWS